MDDITQRLRSGFGGLVPSICDEAANLIETLQSELAALRESVRWIPLNTAKAAMKLYEREYVGQDAHKLWEWALAEAQKPDETAEPQGSADNA